MTTAQAEQYPRYSKGAARRESILAGAEALFAEVGYNQPTMIDIAARCGISRGGLLRYFPTKESVLVAVLERRGMTQPAESSRPSASRFETSELQGIWAERGHRFDALLKLQVVEGNLGDALRGLMMDNASDRKYLELFVTLSAEATNPAHPAHEFFLNHYSMVHDRVLQHVRMAMADTVSLRPNAADAAPGLAASVVAVMDGLQIQSLYDPELDIVAAFDTFLHAVGLLS